MIYSLAHSLSSMDFDEFREGAKSILDRSKNIVGLLTPDKVVQRSTKWHPSGLFMVLNIAQTKPAEPQIRMHFWRTKVVGIPAEPHEHPWHLSSRVLRGTYVEYLPSVTPSTDATEYELKRVDYPQDSNERAAITDCGTVAVDYGTASVYEVGVCHTLPSSTYHATPALSSDTITLAVMGARFNEYAYYTQLKGRTAPSSVDLELSPSEVQWLQEQVEQIRQPQEATETTQQVSFGTSWGKL